MNIPSKRFNKPSVIPSSAGLKIFYVSCWGHLVVSDLAQEMIHPTIRFGPRWGIKMVAKCMTQSCRNTTGTTGRSWEFKDTESQHHQSPTQCEWIQPRYEFVTNSFRGVNFQPLKSDWIAVFRTTPWLQSHGRLIFPLWAEAARGDQKCRTWYAMLARW